MSTTLLSISGFALMASTSISASAEVRLRNFNQIKSQYGLHEYAYDLRNTKNLKIAILDNDFAGFPQSMDSLPEGTEYVRGPLASGPTADQGGHGLLMAQIVWNLIKSPQSAPKFYLMQANGITNFKAAIDSAIEKRVDMILYAANWETGGNFDGKGFINREVNRATREGITWINAAGNYHGQIFNSPVVVNPATQSLRLPGPNDTLTFEVKYSQTPVKLTLSWNDYKNEEEFQTQKDLDWEIVDWTGKVFPIRNLKQGTRSRCGDKPAYAQGERSDSLHSREEDTVMLGDGVYYLRIIDCSGNFTTDDKIRLVMQSAKPDAIKFDHATRNYEIMPPADNPSVITVGDMSPVSAIGPTTDGRIKPDLILPFTKVEMSDGKVFNGGSSIAAAIYAGIYANLWSYNQKLNRSYTMKYLEKLRNEQRNDRRYPRTNGIGPIWRTPTTGEFDSVFW